jgi:hypothetical protein
MGRTLADEELPLARAIYEETEGNPFFVREVLRHLAESGATHLPVEELGIPEGVREVVGRRLARLSRDTNHVLRVASVVGTEFEVPVLQEAEHVDDDELLSALEEACEARLIVDAPGNRYRFAHSLVRHTLYESLSAARRVRLHRRVGEAIESVHAQHLDEYMPALVHHWSRAAAPRAETARAVRYAVRAGDLAQAQLAHHEAVSYYRQGLELLEAGGGDDAQRAQLLVSLGEAQHRMGDPGYRATILEGAGLAERLGDADCLARAALAGYRGMWTMSLGVDRERVAALEAALQAWEGREDLVRARLLANLAVELMFADRQRRWALSDEALTVARRLGDRPTLGRVLLSRIAALWEPGALTERRAHVGELLALAADLGDPFVKVWAELYGFETAMEIGEVDEADRLLAEAQRTALEVERALRWFAEYARAGRALFAGRLAEADVLAREALEIGRATQPLNEFRIIYGVQRFEIRVEQDRADELLPGLTEATGTGNPESRAMLAQAYCELGRLEDARWVFDPLMAVLADVLPDPNWIVTVTRAASVCAELGDRAAAGRLSTLLAPYADRIAGNGVIWMGSVAHYLGLLATTLEHFDEAERYLVASDAAHERLHAPGWRARTRLAWARLLLRRGQAEDAKQARQLLGQVIATARDLGLVNLEPQSSSDATSPSPSGPPGPCGLERPLPCPVRRVRGSAERGSGRQGEFDVRSPDAPRSGEARVQKEMRAMALVRGSEPVADAAPAYDTLTEARQQVMFGLRALYGLSPSSIRLPLNERESIDSGQVCVTIDPDADPSCNVGLIDYERGKLTVRYGGQLVFPGLFDLVMGGRFDPGLLHPVRGVATDDCTLTSDLTGWRADGRLQFLPGSIWAGAHGY